jgi:hypothetical protein
MYEKLLRYSEAFGDCGVPAEWKVDLKLGRWITTQWRRKRQGKLAKDRIRRLDEIGFRWEKRGVNRLLILYIRSAKPDETIAEFEIPGIGQRE